MAKVKVLFTAGHNIVGNTVEFLTHSRWAHASVFLLGGIIEAISPAVTISPVDKYDQTEQEIIEVEIPDVIAAEEQAGRLVGLSYGLFTDCLDGGLNDVIGYHAKGNGIKTVNCSETVTRILRAGGLNILQDIAADCVTPESLYQELLSINEQEVA